jgi:hypothetical protein
MTENLNLYTRLGHIEFRRPAEFDFTLIRMRKQLGRPGPPPAFGLYPDSACELQ